MGESVNRIFIKDDSTKYTVDADKLIKRLERLRDALPETAKMSMTEIINVVIGIIEAEEEIYEATRNG